MTPPPAVRCDGTARYLRNGQDSSLRFPLSLFDAFRRRFNTLMFDFNDYKGKFALAPLAGVGDSAFRTVCAEGGAAFTVSEMVSAKALHYGDASTEELLFITPCERPCGIQLFGSEPELMAEAAREVARFSPDFIDINMGCPVPKIAGNGDGSALLKDEALAARVMEAVAGAAAVPVSVKLRTGWDDAHIVAPRYAVIAQECGLSAVAVHGRTRAGGYAAPVDLDAIARVKSAVSIPVFGNGGVFSPADAARMFSATGCDGILVGRGALGNPLIFRELGGGAAADDAQRLAAFARQVRLAAAQKGEFVALREARKHAGWYFRGMRGAAELRRCAGGMTTLSELDELIDRALSAQ